MAHKNPNQIERIIHSISKPGVDIYIHLDSKIPKEDFQYLADIEHVYFIKRRIKISWGTYTITKAILSSLEELNRKLIPYSHFIIISGQDYPIKPVHKLYDLLLNEPKCNLIEIKDLGDPWYKEARSRIRTFSIYAFGLKIGGMSVQDILTKYFQVLRYSYKKLEIYGAPSSTFMVLSKECSQYLISYFKKNLALSASVRFTWGVDEFIFQTLIMNSKFRETVIPNKLSYTVWGDDVLHPQILKEENLPDLLKSTRYFARKFDLTIDSKIFDSIDQQILKPVLV